MVADAFFRSQESQGDCLAATNAFWVIESDVEQGGGILIGSAPQKCKSAKEEEEEEGVITSLRSIQP